MNKPYIPVLLGTGREGRFSEKVANYVLEKVKTFELETELLDVRDFSVPFTVHPAVENEKTKKWKAIAQKASAFIFVVPEYNHGYPGEFKLWLDQALAEYKNKPVLVCGVSSGGFGGTRMFLNLLPVLHYLGLQAVGDGIPFSKVKDDFTNPDYTKLDEKYLKQIEAMVSSLLKNV